MCAGKNSDSPFSIPDMSYDDYRDQDVVETNDGAFFDALDEMFGIEPRTDRLKNEDEEAQQTD